MIIIIIIIVIYLRGGADEFRGGVLARGLGVSIANGFFLPTCSAGKRSFSEISAESVCSANEVNGYVRRARVTMSIVPNVKKNASSSARKTSSPTKRPLLPLPRSIRRRRFVPLSVTSPPCPLSTFPVRSRVPRVPSRCSNTVCVTPVPRRSDTFAKPFTEPPRQCLRAYVRFQGFSPLSAVRGPKRFLLAPPDSNYGPFSAVYNRTAYRVTIKPIYGRRLSSPITVTVIPSNEFVSKLPTV